MTETTSAHNGNFYADPELCIACGLCVDDCVANIIDLNSGTAAVAPEDMANCLHCQHCLTICPNAAVSVSDLSPHDSIPVGAPSPKALDLLMRSRRSIRRFDPEPVDRALLNRVLESAAYAPTGVNARNRRFTVILDPKVMAELRDRCCRALVEAEDRIPEQLNWLVKSASKWLEKGRDVVFRTAPHILVVTAGPGATTPVADCLIALSYFELAANTNDIATVWCGMVEMMLQYVPETRRFFGIPDDHVIGYAMLFGRPGVQYQRTAQYSPEEVVVLDSFPN